MPPVGDMESADNAQGTAKFGLDTGSQCQVLECLRKNAKRRGGTTTEPDVRFAGGPVYPPKSHVGLCL